MIVDNHVHIFPNQAGPAGYSDANVVLRHHQQTVRYIWGRLISSHTDPRHVPDPDEDVGFSVGKHGRFLWRKHDEDCWLQRGPVVMIEMEHTLEQMLAHMDFVGVDMGVIHADYMEPSYGREVFIADAIRRWPNRFIGTAAIDYDFGKDDKALQAEIRKLERAVEELGFRALLLPIETMHQPLDDRRFDSLWEAVIRLGIPVYMHTGFNSRDAYLEQIRRIKNILDKRPEMNVVVTHIGGNIRHPKDPEYVDNPRELFPLLRSGHFYLELGYVLAYENPLLWGRDYEYPYPRHKQIIQAIYEQIGAHAMVWGSDMPWTQRTCTYRQNLDLIRLHTEFMAEADRKLVMGGNLARLFRVGTT